MNSKGYNDGSSTVQRFHNINTDVSDDALEVLQLFAQYESLTGMQITNIIKSTNIQRKYKNVYCLIKKLKTLGLIEQQKNVDKARRRHNEIYFKLTDEGIYLLFLKARYHGILIDQLSAKKGEPPVSHIDNFIRYYGDNFLFNLFLYPYFEKRTIYAVNIGLLHKLFKYLHDCCKQVDYSRSGYVLQSFFWNKIPGEDNSKLLMSLREVFALQNVDTDNSLIEKTADNSTITVTTPQVRIVIKLDETKKKATAIGDTLSNNPSKYDYMILYYGHEMIACVLQEDKSHALDTRRLLEAPIYELVCDIGRDSDVSEEQVNLLAQDTNFTKLVEQA
jgi:predicted transcriptional regulator